MTNDLSQLENKEATVLISGGPKGITKIKGTIIATDQEEGLFTLETGGGMMGGKKKHILFNIYSVLGIEVDV